MDGLDTLLSRFDAPVATLARALVEALRGAFPELGAQVKHGWGSVNFSHPQAGFLCAVFPRHEAVQLYFEQGRLLSSPLLEAGTGTRQVRWITLHPDAAIPLDEIAILVSEAIALKS